MNTNLAEATKEEKIHLEELNESEAKKKEEGIKDKERLNNSLLEFPGSQAAEKKHDLSTEVKEKSEELKQTVKEKEESRDLLVIIEDLQKQMEGAFLVGDALGEELHKLRKENIYLKQAQEERQVKLQNSSRSIEEFQDQLRVLKQANEQKATRIKDLELSLNKMNTHQKEYDKYKNSLAEVKLMLEDARAKAQEYQSKVKRIQLKPPSAASA